MALKSNFNFRTSMADLIRQSEGVKKKVIEALVYAGEEFLTDSRNQPSDHSLGFYQDVTTNLRNSVQYFILDRGEMRGQSLSPNQDKNMTEIKELINKSGIQLIGIAGMEYASIVESKGYNVITQQADKCIKEVGILLNDVEIWASKQ